MERNGNPGAASPRAPELLAPAGDRESAYAAFAYGADAIYAGLKRFSARAEAVNLTLDELGEVTAYAHQLKPARRVYLALNTLVTDRELLEAADAVAAAADIGVDALIVQDLGVVRLARRFFPGLRLHASTQMLVHNLAGARALAELGIARVVPARELTLDEIRDLAANSGIETEIFVHGALCYSYSGLCLFSARFRGRGGNRGRCAYPCRDVFRRAADDEGRVPFSMKDLARTEAVGALCAAGVTSLKIEGRKKSPLYVAAVTRLYRGILDGSLDADQRRAAEGDVKAVFSRPWTPLYLRSRREPNVTDAQWVGPRGLPVGRVEAMRRTRGDTRLLRFTPLRAIQIRDGLQVDVPGQDRPYGFAVTSIRPVRGGHDASGTVFESAAGDTVDVALPADAPRLPDGATVYLSSSQAVKQAYRYTCPPPGEFRARRPVVARLALRAGELRGRLETTVAGVGPVTAEVVLPAARPLEAAREPQQMATTARKAFEKLGDTTLLMEAFAIDNPDGLFAPVSNLNALRRDAAAALELGVKRALLERRDAMRGELDRCGKAAGPLALAGDGPSWSVKVDRAGLLDAFDANDLIGVAEVVVDIELAELDELLVALASLAGRMGRARIRLALPAITRVWETRRLVGKIAGLTAEGWTRWEVSNVSGWQMLAAWGKLGDVTADWPLYVLNRCAFEQLRDMGAGRAVVSPEDSPENLAALVSALGEAATVIAYQDTPLFTSEACAFASMTGDCPGPDRCRHAEMALVSGHGEEILALNRSCRTVVIAKAPYRLPLETMTMLRRAGARRFRADFLYRRYDAAQVVATWRDLRDVNHSG